MVTAFLIGRIIFALYWLNVAYGHIVKSAGLIGYSQAKGVKSPKLAVIGSGILALLGGLSILTGWKAYYGIVLLVIFLLGVSFKIHPYWKESDPMAKMGDRVNFMKNMALVGALLVMFAIPWSAWIYPLGW